MKHNEEPKTISTFLDLVFAGQDHGMLALFCKPSNLTRFINLSHDRWQYEAAKNAMQLRDHGDMYFGVGIQGSQPAKGRGKAAGVISIPGFWADLDVRGPNHTAVTLPPTIDDVWQIMLQVPFKPTLVVYTGGGIQPYWLFKEPWEFQTDAERRKARALSKAFHKRLQAIAAGCGWVIDDTADLCRLLRVPGTYNRKQVEPVLVHYEVIEDGRHYNPSDFEEFLELEADPELKAHAPGAASAERKADFRLVLGECAWMRHCKDDADALPEPEWYKMLSIVSRCRDGERLAHALSKPYPNYKAAETSQKLKQAMDKAGPATCSYIAGDLGQSQYCECCKNWGKVKSPIVLGLPRKSKLDVGRQRGAPCEGRDYGRQEVGQLLPQIQVGDRQLRDETREAIDALRRFNEPPSLFVRSGNLVFITEREKGHNAITDLTHHGLRNRLTRAADFYEITLGGSRNCPPPKCRERYPRYSTD